MKNILKSAVRVRKRTHQGEAARKKLFQKKESRAAGKQKAYMESFKIEAKREERRMRKEDWELGPLAPRHDYGQIEGHFGSANVNLIHQPPVPEHEQRTNYPLFVGDRVAIMAGRCKGQIGVIQRIDQQRHGAFIEGLNTLDVKLEEYHHEMVGHKRPYQTLDGSFALSDLRIVHEIRDRKTQQNKIAIVDRMKVERKSIRDDTVVARYVAGTKIEIPLPEKAKEPEKRGYGGDTPLERVKKRTWTPMIFQSPMPHSVIDELRSKHSRWRKRFDPEFVQAKIAQEEAKARFADPEYNDTRTPMQELMAEKAKYRKATPWPEVPSEEMLQKMDELLAAKMAAKQTARQSA